MIPQETLLVSLGKLVDRIYHPSRKEQRKRGHPKQYCDRMFLKALVIMIVRHLHTVHELLTVLAQPTTEMEQLRRFLTENGHYPTRRTWERRLESLARPSTRPDWLFRTLFGRPHPAVGSL